MKLNEPGTPKNLERQGLRQQANDEIIKSTSGLKERDLDPQQRGSQILRPRYPNEDKEDIVCKKTDSQAA